MFVAWGMLVGQPLCSCWYWCVDQTMVQRVLSAKGARCQGNGTPYGGEGTESPVDGWFLSMIYRDSACFNHPRWWFRNHPQYFHANWGVSLILRPSWEQLETAPVLTFIWLLHWPSREYFQSCLVDNMTVWPTMTLLTLSSCYLAKHDVIIILTQTVFHHDIDID